MRATWTFLTVVGWGAVLIGVSSPALPSADPPKAVVYQGVPEGYDFPAKRLDLEKLRDTNDVAGMRRHVWMVFAGATQPAKGGEAIWETWYSKEETFDPAATKALGRSLVKLRPSRSDPCDLSLFA